MRVFLGLTEIAGYYRGLHRGLREIGVESVYACGGHHFAYAEDGERQSWPVHLFRWLSFQRLAVPRPRRAKRAALKAAHWLSRIPLLLWALVKCDVFVFGYGSCFLCTGELRIFRLLGKRTIHVFHGSDNRPCYLDGTVVQSERLKDAAAVLKAHRLQHALVKQIERLSDCLVSHPATAQYFERPYVNWLLATGLPFAGDGAAPAESAEPARTVRVLHCPSDPAVKGTEFIRSVIRSLKEKGHEIDYRELMNRPNREVLEELRACDFVMDQAYADYPMAGFATEAAHFGKPAVVGGYAQAICAEIERGNGLPCRTYCRPEEMEQLTERMICDAAFRRECGRKAREFVNSAWSRRTIAEHWVRLMRDDIPAAWLVQPEQIHYLGGVGLTPEALQAGIAWFIQNGGVEQLFMEHRDDLAARLLADQVAIDPPECVESSSGRSEKYS